MSKTLCDLQIIRACPSEAGRLSQIAHAAKGYWAYPAHWIELWHNQLTITPAYIEANPVWAAHCEEQILGFYSLMITPAVFRAASESNSASAATVTLDNMWVMPVAMGQGIGKRLFQHAVMQSMLCGAEVIEIESDPHAEPFYQHMGAETVGEVAYTLEGARRSLPLMHYHLVLSPV